MGGLSTELIALAFTIPAVLIGLVLLFLPLVLDLLWRPQTVPWWWGAPLLLSLPGLAGAGFLQATVAHGPDRYSVLWVSLACAHLGIGGILVWMTLCLALSRGIRPGGETRRKRWSILVLGVVLVGILLSILSAPWLPPRLLFMLWVQVPAWVSLFWVALLHREGPARLVNARRASAGWLVASAGCACIAFLHPVLYSRLAIPLEFWNWAAMSGVALLGFMGGLRVLTPIGWVAPSLAVMSGVSLWIPPLWFALYDPLPEGVVVPEWVDLTGEPGPPLPFAQVDCISVVEQEAVRRVGCQGPLAGMIEWYAISPEVPLSTVAVNSPQRLLVDRGRGSIGSRYGRNETVISVREENGRAVVDDGITLELGPGLHQYLQQLPGRPLVVERTPHWTLGDFVAMCASTGPTPSCSLSGTSQ